MSRVMTRREFVALGAALPAVFASPALPPQRAGIRASGTPVGAGNPDITVGITVDTRPDWNGAGNFIRSLDESSSVGYHWIETFWNYVERWADNPAGLKEELDKRNLKLETVSNGGRMRVDFVDPAQRDLVMADHLKLVNFIRWFGCDHLKINIGGRHAAGDRMPAYRTMAATFDELGKRMADMGMKLGVHPHLGSPLQTKQDTEAIMELTNPTYVHLVLDTGHTSMAGMDPVQLTRAYHARIIEYHIKDVAPEDRGGHKGPLREPYNTTADNRIFFELGKGGVDFPAIKRILDDHRWKGWFTVELDRTGTTAKESCTIAKRYLETVLKLKV